MTQQFHSGVHNPCKKKTRIRKDIRTPMSITALFIIAKVWKQPKRTPIDEWIKTWYIDIWYIEDYPAIKKNEILPFAATGLGYQAK